MKKHIAKYFAIGALVLAIGCEEIPLGDNFLEKPPSVDVTKDTIFANLEMAQRYLFAGYSTLYYGLPYTFAGDRSLSNCCLLDAMTDIMNTDITWTGVSMMYYSGRYIAAEEDNLPHVVKFSWKYPLAWNGIRIGYNFIDNIDRVPDADLATKRQLKAEARMLIAMHYVNYYRHFGGGLPWLGHTVDVNEDMKFERLTSLATLDSIVATIDQAIPDLPWVVDDPSNWDGRFTQAAAMGLKARILLFAASPVLNANAPYLDGEASDKNMTWHGGYDPELWKRAADAAHDLIEKVESMGGYALVNTGDPRTDFRNAYAQRGNSEALISVRVQYKSPAWLAWGTLGQVRGGTSNPTDNYVKMFPMANGLPITDPLSGYDPADPYVNRDPRLYETVLVNGDTYKGRTAELWIGGRERRNINQNRGKTGYQMRKWIMDDDPATSRGAVTHWACLRLPEIYLSYAEAISEYNGGPDAEAYRCINLVRNRVNLGDLPAGLSQEEFREAVLLERALEFGFEEVRLYDLIRWKMEDEFTKPLYRMNITLDAGVFTYTQAQITPRFWATNWSPKWYFSALPPSEVNKGYGLVQNPGW
jgi:hypothetical protein